MSKFDTKMWNLKMAKTLGYIHQEDNIILDNGVLGFTEDKILSKVKIVVDEYRDEECGVVSRYLGRVKPSDPKSWDSDTLELWGGKIEWASENFGKFIYLKLWNPDRDWNQLVKVADELGMSRITTDINKAYGEVCGAIDAREELS